MRRIGLGAGIAMFALLAGCSDEQSSANTTTTIDVNGSDANIVVPEANVAVAPANAVEGEGSPALNIAPDGLSLIDPASGAARHVAFGTSRDAAIPMVAGALGSPMGQSINAECGAGPLEHVEFRGGLTLFMQEGSFVGWDLDGDGPLSTANGIAIGSTLTQLRGSGSEVSVEQSSIGTEFASGELRGLLSADAPEGRVTNLWAGTTCIFR